MRTMVKKSLSTMLFVVLFAGMGPLARAWTSSSTSPLIDVVSGVRLSSSLQAKPTTTAKYDEEEAVSSSSPSMMNIPLNPRRRDLLENAFRTTALAFAASATSAVFTPNSNAEVVRAVGGAEVACREAGNCLETGQLDGAVGWNWGGKDRCDPTDPLCGNDGRMMEQLVGRPVPQPAADVTHVAAIQVEIGRGEFGVLKLGFYGTETPGGVQQMLDFLSQGLTASPAKTRTDDTLGMKSVPVQLSRGGIVDLITPGSTVDFGVPSQTNAYARSRGMSKAGDNFLPQGRPDTALTAQDKAPCSHSAAGLISIPRKGLGYGGSGFESEDEAYESSFLVTAASMPALDKNRLVVGQVLDAPSMALLERLASLPTKKGIKGVIPGQSSGPPLLRVVVRETETSAVSSRATTSS